ncbi:MAG: lysyl-tRNA synthetase, class [Candidatus Peribacteria bacterium]|nr:lysyl-tRNA synthetase, class [Candidatus Peribacteria bacterium]
MKLIVDPRIFEKFPGLHVGAIIVRSADNTLDRPDVLSMLRTEEGRVRALLPPETFKEHPSIAAWQQAHRAFGSNPNSFPPSIQALVRRVVKGGELPQINTLVELYNIISLKYILPVGGEDLDTCQGDIQLTLAEGTERFVELGATENDPPKPGEVIYKDDLGVICRRFNWREADRTKLTKQTKNAVVVIESLSHLTDLLSAVSEVTDLIKQFCGGTVNSFILAPENASMHL